MECSRVSVEVNGEERGSQYGNPAVRFGSGRRVRSGDRWYVVNIGIGFRTVNGVVRSGYYIYSSYACCRSGRRTQLSKGWNSLAVNVGFRTV